MSERPVEDEIIAEARNFGRALMALASQHGRAVSWLEQRRIRKEISRALRQQRQAEFLDRQKQLMWTEQSVDRYRAHAYAVALRSNDPRVDADRRARDQVSLRSHAVDLQARVLNGRSLKPVEQGIALDGIAATTAFPGHDRKGSLFAGARRVKGINALRYRATVARTREALPQQLAEVREQHRQLTVAPSAADRPQATVKQATPQQLEAAVQELRRAQLDWDLNAADASPAELRGYDRKVQTAARAAAGVGVSQKRIDWERAHAVENSKFAASVYSLRPGGTETQVTQTLHPNQRQAAEWTDRTVRSTNWVPQVALKAVIHERGAQAPAHVADGTYEQVSARTGSWVPSQQRENAETPASAPQPSPDADRLAEVERQLKDIAEDRDRLSSKVTTLQKGFDSVAAARDDMRSKLDAAEGRISELTNRNQRLAAEIDEVRRDQPNIEQLRAERDRFKTERDEAVARLTEQTSPRERFGSRERVAADTQSMPNPRTNGHNGRERSH